jgi:hypothetical protein
LREPAILNVHAWLVPRLKAHFKGTKKLEDRWNKCDEKDGDYIEKNDSILLFSKQIHDGYCLTRTRNFIYEYGVHNSVRFNRNHRSNFRGNGDILFRGPFERPRILQAGMFVFIRHRPIVYKLLNIVACRPVAN